MTIERRKWTRDAAPRYPAKMSNGFKRRSFLKGAAAAIGAIFVGRPKISHALPPAPSIAADEAPVATPPAASPAPAKIPSIRSCILPMSSSFPSSSLLVLPGQTITVTRRPQEPFRADRVIIARANDWVVNDLKINSISQLDAPNQPGKRFAADLPQQDPLVRHDVCPSSINVMMTVTYVGTEPTGEPFVCGILGHVPM